MRHIKAALVRDFDQLIDMSDYAKASDEQQEKVFCTRALAAFALQRFADVDQVQAASCVVDGSNDNGIDAIYLDQANSKVILVQSKWDSNGTATIGLGDSRNFVAGFKDLTDERFDRFNDKIARQKDLISEALGDPSVRFVLVVATTGASTLNPVVHL